MAKLVSLLVCAALAVSAANAAYFCAIYDPSTDAFSIANGDTPACASSPYVVVSGEFNDTLLSIGWDVLKFQTNETFSNALQARGGGFFEGVMTANRAVTFLQNNYYPNGSSPMNPKTLAFLEANWDYVQQQVQIAPPSNRFWHHVNLTIHQLRGMMQGYAYAGVNITTGYALTLAAQGDLMDLDNVYPPLGKEVRDWRNMNTAEFNKFLMTRSHCSALIKVTPQLDRLYFAHSTWQSYGFTMRVYKMLTFNFNDAFTRARRVSFSSYPGALSSLDDFYVTDSGLTVIETSLNVFNFSMYNVLTPNSVLSWMRVVVANRVAVGGADWYQLFSTQNSGTYNNQWMVVDRTLFTPGQDLVPNLLWIVEQLPGYMEGRDMTGALAYGYWPSYNVPYFTTVFNLANYPEAIKAQGSIMLDYETCARAQMFREYQTNVVSIESLQFLMQYNNYLYEPISENNPIYSIAARGDLCTQAQGGPQFFGAIDSKVSDYRMAMAGGQVLAFMGPTPQQAVFEWGDFPADTLPPHAGLPAVYNFSYVLMQ